MLEDEGCSGGNIYRPNFQEMLRLIRKKEINVLICYRLDRISRNIADFSNLINELSKYNVDFISIKEQFDTRTPMRSCNDVYCICICSIRKRSNCRKNKR